MIRVLLPHACFGLVVFPARDGVARISEAPPIARWTLGKPAREVWDYYAKRGSVQWFPMP